MATVTAQSAGALKKAPAQVSLHSFSLNHLLNDLFQLFALFICFDHAPHRGCIVLSPVKAAALSCVQRLPGVIRMFRHRSNIFAKYRTPTRRRMHNGCLHR